MVETVFLDKAWYDNFRVSKETFQYIVTGIEGEIVRKEKNWFSKAKRLHYSCYSSRARFSGARINFTRARTCRTTYSVGPNTG